MQVVSIPEDKYFYAIDGTVIRSLGELPDALRNMSPEAFSHHVNDDKNDFHAWVNDVFAHSSLARKLKRARRKEDMAKQVFIEIFS